VEALREYLAEWPQFLPFLAMLVVTVVAASLAHRILLHRQGTSREHGFARQFTVLAIATVGLVAAVMAIPMSGETRRAVLSLISIGLTAVVAMSSTTIVSNFMAGLMLRLVRSFHPGDFIRVNEQFGKVTALGILHTEIQTETRDLATIPNALLVSSPVTVVRSSGTIVTADLSLGYDLSHSRVEELLVEAAEKAGLDKPFVLVTELGNFSVGYRVAGFLEDVKGLVTARSKLRSTVLDTLHAAGVEIVSPTFMNQRPLEKEDRFIARPERTRESQDYTAEEIVFDKANEVEKIEELEKQQKRIEKEIEELPHDEEDRAAQSRRTRLERELESTLHELDMLRKKTEKQEE